MAPRRAEGGLPAIAAVTILTLNLAAIGCLPSGGGGEAGAKPAKVTVKFVCSERGWIEYRLDSGKALRTNEELGREIAELRKRSGEVLVAFDVGGSNAFYSEIEAAATACTSAGGTVLEKPISAVGDEAEEARAGRRKVNLPVRAVGVRDGVMQYRIGDRLLEGDDDALLEALRNRAEEIKKAQNGFTLIRVFWQQAPELVLDDLRLQDLETLIGIAGLRVANPMRDWERTPVASLLAEDVRIDVVAPLKAGSRYRFKNRMIDGEEALWAELLKELEDFRAGKEDPQHYVLRLSFKAEIEKGVTATEEQLVRIRKIFPRYFTGKPFPAAAPAAPEPPKGAGAGAAAVKVKVTYNQSGLVEYRLDSGQVLGNLADLGREIGSLRAHHEVVLVACDGRREGIFPEEVAAAENACQAAGGTVLGMPPVAADPQVAEFRAAGRRARIEVKGVGTRDGVLQFRIDGKRVEGTIEVLTAAVRSRIAEIEAEQGGFTVVTPAWFSVPELEVPAPLSRACSRAIRSAGPQISRKAVARWGGVAGVDSELVFKKVRVDLVGQFKSGSRYLLNGQSLDGEEALWKALEKELADFRAGKEKPRDHVLDLQFRAKVAPGVTATEEQLALAKNIFGGRFDGGPKHRYVSVRAVGVRDGVIQYRVGDKRLLMEGEAPLVEHFHSLAKDLRPGLGGMPQVRPYFWAEQELAFGDRDLESAVRKAARDAQPGIPEIPAQKVWRWDDKGGPAAKSVKVTILGPLGQGSRYDCEGRTLEGEEALKAELAKLLAAHRAGKDEPGKYTLWVELRAEVKPGATVTEGQLGLARRAVKDSGVTKPEGK